VAKKAYNSLSTLQRIAFFLNIFFLSEQEEPDEEEEHEQETRISLQAVLCFPIHFISIWT
jgi:hypothetical protein